MMSASVMEDRFAAPASRWCAVQAALRDEVAHAVAEAPQTDFALAQRPHRVAARAHSGLHALDQLLVLDIHLAIDPPVEVARRPHLASIVGMHIRNLTNQRLR